VKRYCRLCGYLVCVNCSFENHSDHKKEVYKVDDYVSKGKQDVNHLIQKIEDKLSNSALVKLNISNNATLKKELEKEQQELEESIMFIKNKLDGIIETSKNLKILIIKQIDDASLKSTNNEAYKFICNGTYQFNF
jgi:hypothetical protein